MLKNVLSELIGTDYKTEEMFRLGAREVLQNVVLNGLSRGNFFKHAAFQGGTALRIIYSLERFSEDLDFVLFEKEDDFKLERYVHYVESEISSYGLQVNTKFRDNAATGTSSGEVRCNMKEVVMVIGFPEGLVRGIHRDELLRIKIDVDTNPPAGANYQKISRPLPINHYLCVLDKPSLFAGKISAVIGRGWKKRVKGRDFYDYLWYVKEKVPVNMAYLKNNLEREGIIDKGVDFDLDVLKELLTARFKSIDYDSAIKDIKSYLLDNTSIPDWNSELFLNTLDKLTFQ